MRMVTCAAVAFLVIVGASLAGPGKDQAKGKGAGKGADRQEQRQQAALQAFESADADNNGFLSRAEFSNAMRALREARGGNRQGQRGGNGAAEKAKSKGAGKGQAKGAGKGQGKAAGKGGQKGGRARGDRPSPDQNNDGQISKEEFMQFLSSMRERSRGAQGPRGTAGQGRGASKKGKKAKDN